MKKTLNIGGKRVEFVQNAITPFIYKQEFNRDFFGDMIRMGEFIAEDGQGFTNLDKIDFNLFTEMAYACAKSADESIPDIMDWLRDNPEFNVIEHGMDVLEMIMESMDTKKK